MRIRSSLFALASVTALPLAAQQPDSLVQRLERAEERIAVLEQQVAQQAGNQGAVTTHRGASVELSGLVLMNGFYNDDWVYNVDLPMFATPPDPAGLRASSAGGTVRQTRLTLFGFAPGVLGGNASAELDIDFWGGQLKGGRVNPLIRIRRTRADLRWRNAWIMAGQEAPPIAELNPSSLAALGIPEFSYSGNLWIWLPQVRVGVITGDRVRIGLEASALAPRTGADVGTFGTQADQAEQVRRPQSEARLLVRWGDVDQASELSIGGHYGWLLNNADSIVASRAAAASAQVFLGRYFELRGEAYVGEALVGLGGGGIGQNLTPTGAAVRTKGGWVQLNAHPGFAWELGVAYAIEDPNDADLDPVNGRAKNLGWSLHAIWRPSPLVFAAEYRRLETTYVNSVFGLLTANHVNLAAGFEF